MHPSWAFPLCHGGTGPPWRSRLPVSLPHCSQEGPLAILSPYSWHCASSDKVACR